MPQAHDPKPPSVLIIGADGQIGRTLFTDLKRFGFATTPTSRRSARIDDEHTVHLDLSSPVLFESPENHDTAFICAGVTSIAECERDQAKTWEINVTRTIELIKQLSSRNTHVIYLSSNVVFSGQKAHVSTHEEQNPNCNYGQQKHAVESFLSDFDGRTTTLRLSKVVGPSFPLLEQWVTRLKNAEPVKAYNDMVLSPVSLNSVVSACAKLATQKPRGIFHLSGAQDISYGDLARFLANELKVSLDLIQTSHAHKSNQVIFSKPAHTTLDTASALKQLGFEPEKWTDVIRYWLENHQA